MDFASQALGIGALADPTRRALYDYVVSQGSPVGREQAAADLGLASHNANFHLDRLVTEGLLEVEYRRLSGKTGPGAGRPSKLYMRAGREFSVSLPPRRYDLVGEILAAALSEPQASEDLPTALQQHAQQAGREAAGAMADLDGDDDESRLTRVLAGQGFEPDEVEGALVLRNCPFDALAQKYTNLVCGLNVDFVQGVIDGLGCAGLQACLDPSPGRCCVAVRTLPAGSDQDATS
ncbi:MAG TPA: transcriptional regulator [Marmoricola sp.]|nr:transcriptional regulator [Marmoricola sp.]